MPLRKCPLALLDQNPQGPLFTIDVDFGVATIGANRQLSQESIHGETLPICELCL